MKFGLFLGCNIPARLLQYQSSARAVSDQLGIELFEIKEFNCCGYPLRNINFNAFILASARNLALAEKADLPVMALCKCCYGSLKKTDHLLKENPFLKKEVNAVLAKEALSYQGDVEIKHFLSVLFHDVGIGAIEAKIEKTVSGLKIATHYGCHVLRPSKVVRFDDPVNPTLFDQLVAVTGAESIDWSTKSECCGAPLWGVNHDLSRDLTRKKLSGGKESGAHYLCTACPYCQIQFDTVQEMILEKENYLPSLLYPQLLGLCLGVDEESLGLEQNRLPINGLKDVLSKS